MTDKPTPLLTGIVVNWFEDDRTRRLAAAWPKDDRFELLIVDNGSKNLLSVETGRVLSPGTNLGFAGAVNLASKHTSSAAVLLLNPDVSPTASGLEALLRGLEQLPESAGLAPRLRSPGGDGQYRWQLRRLPTLGTLLLQSLLLPADRGESNEPAAGSVIAQPAAAALVLRKRILDQIGGLDASFYPAWFEDVDLARRLEVAAKTLTYWPDAEFEHELGVSVSRLGYPRFLFFYYTNLCRYLAKHHGARWALVARSLLIPGALVRLVLVPLRKPIRANSRSEAAIAFLTLALGSLTGWRYPVALSAGTRPDPTGTRSTP